MSQYSTNNYTGSKNNSLTRAYDLIQSKSYILDVGCSSGNFGRALIEMKACIVDGIEIDRGDAKAASKYLRNIWIGNIESGNIVIPAAEYDYISFCDVIEHLVRPQKALEKIKEHLKPGGKVLFSIPNMAHGSVRLELLKGNFTYGMTGLLDDTHLHFYTKEEIVGLFERAGYKIEKLQYTEVDYDEKVIKYELSTIGLEINDKIRDIFTEETAVAYQYIGLAVPVSRKSKSSRRALAPDPEYPYTNYYKEKEELAKRTISDLENENEALRQKISNIDIPKLSKIKQAVKSIIRSK